MDKSTKRRVAKPKQQVLIRSFNASQPDKAVCCAESQILQAENRFPKAIDPGSLTGGKGLSSSDVHNRFKYCLSSSNIRSLQECDRTRISQIIIIREGVLSCLVVQLENV